MFFRCFVSSTEAGRAKFLSVRDKQQLSWLRNQWSELGRQNGDGGGGGGRSALTSDRGHSSRESCGIRLRGALNEQTAAVRSCYGGRCDAVFMQGGMMGMKWMMGMQGISSG